MKVYCAGPDVFHPQAMIRAAFQRGVCQEYGLEALHPLDNDVKFETPDGWRRESWEIANEIKNANCAMMREADVIVANLTPFRGPGMDQGTAFEIGFMDALRKPIYGYSVVSLKTDIPYAARVADRHREGNMLVDAKGWMVEDFGLVENLMIAIPLRHLVVQCNGHDAWRLAFAQTIQRVRADHPFT